MPGEACAICIEAARDAARIDDCGHGFCRTCLADWFRRSDLCPLCKVFVLSVDGRSRFELFPPATPAPEEPVELAEEHFAAELESLLGRLRVLAQKLEFYRHQAFYGALSDRVFVDLRRWGRLVEGLQRGEGVGVEELREGVEAAHALACRLESGLGPKGPAGLARLVEEAEEEDAFPY